MDKRIPYVVTDGRYFALGTYYNSFTEMEHATDEIVARRERLANLGRPLTSRETLHGVARAPLPGREQLQWENWRPATGEPEAAPVNPFREQLAELKAKRPKSIREALAEKSANEFDARVAAQKAGAEKAAEFAADEKRQKALAIAQSQREWAMFAPEATASDLAHSERTIRQLSEGLLQPGVAMLDTGRERIEAAAKVRQDDLAEKIQALKASYRTEKLEEPKPPKSLTYYPEGYVGVSAEERERANREYFAAKAADAE